MFATQAEFEKKQAAEFPFLWPQADWCTTEVLLSQRSAHQLFSSATELIHTSDREEKPTAPAVYSAPCSGLHLYAWRRHPFVPAALLSHCLFLWPTPRWVQRYTFCSRCCSGGCPSRSGTWTFSLSPSVQSKGSEQNKCPVKNESGLQNLHVTAWSDCVVLFVYVLSDIWEWECVCVLYC